MSFACAEIWAKVLTSLSCVACEAGAGPIAVALAILATLHWAFRWPIVFSTSNRSSKINTLHRLRCKRGCVTRCSRHCNTTIDALKTNVAFTHTLVANTIARTIIEAAIKLTLVSIELLVADARSH